MKGGAVVRSLAEWMSWGSLTDFHLAGSIQQHVVALDVSVDDRPVVKMFQPTAGLTVKKIISLGWFYRHSTSLTSRQIAAI